MTVMDPGDDLPAAGRSRTDPVPSHHDQTVPPAHSPEQVAAFTAFYQGQVERLVTFLRWQGATLAEAADVAQETMARAFQRWETLIEPGAWIRTVASREFIRRRTQCSEDPVAQVPEVSSALLRSNADLATIEGKHEVLRLLALLPARQRQVMAWTYDGYTPSQIAMELGMTSEAVRSSLKLARRTLAEHLGRGKGRP